jgi:hypothetical protein
MYPRLIPVLACPNCRARVRAEGDQVTCETCASSFEIRIGQFSFSMAIARQHSHSATASNFSKNNNVLKLGLDVFHDVEVPTPVCRDVIQRMICFLIVFLMGKLG